MITKAILELNACVNTLYNLRTSSCALHYVYYDHICCDRFEGMAGRMFEARKYYDMRAILQKATDYTASQIYSMDELNAFIEKYLEKNKKKSIEIPLKKCNPFRNILRHGHRKIS